MHARKRGRVANLSDPAVTHTFFGRGSAVGSWRLVAPVSRLPIHARARGANGIIGLLRAGEVPTSFHGAPGGLVDLRKLIQVFRQLRQLGCLIGGFHFLSPLAGNVGPVVELRGSSGHDLPELLRILGRLAELICSWMHHEITEYTRLQ